MKARHIKAEGTVTEVEPENGKTFSLEELQGFVDGYIELTYTKDGTQRIVCNEEGLLKGLDVNEEATRLYGRALMVGDVLICNEDQIN